MTVAVKICGLTSADAIAAVATGGAAYAGFIFYPPSPRNLAPEQAADLARDLPQSILKVAVFVDPSDDDLAGVLATFKADMIQLHGHEGPRRVAAVRARFGRKVIKAIPVAGDEDLLKARNYQDCADLLLFDAKAPTSMAGALPGGNGLRFDWELIAAAPSFQLPWMLSGGLDAGNIAEAVRVSHTALVDVSSGVEDRPGVKSPHKIKEFLAAVAALESV